MLSAILLAGCLPPAVYAQGARIQGGDGASADAGAGEVEAGEAVGLYFARIRSIDDFVRISDRDRMGYSTVTEPMELKGSYHIQTPRTGGAIVDFPGGASVRIDPGGELSWLDEEITLRHGFFELDIPTLYYVRYAEEEGQGNVRGTRRMARVEKTLDACEQYLQATQRTKFQILLRPGREPKLEVLSGDLREGRDLLLSRQEDVDLEGVPTELKPPTPLLPFDGHSFVLPIEKMSFLLDSLPGRAWFFEFSKEPDFTQLFCRVFSPKNSVELPPFGPGEYFWRAGRINEDGLKTLVSDPAGFLIQ